MKLSELTAELNDMMSEGYGKLPVYVINGETGEASLLSCPCVDEVGEDNPVQGLNVGDKYVSIYGGE